MKRWWLVAPFALALLLLVAEPSEAWSRHGHHWRGGGPRVVVGLGVGWPYWYYPPPYYYYPYPSQPQPIVIQQQPPVYVEQQPVPPAGSAPAAAPQYWYYCQPSGAYYPNVQTCAEPWVKVPWRAQ